MKQFLTGLCLLTSLAIIFSGCSDSPTNNGKDMEPPVLGMNAASLAFSGDTLLTDTLRLSGTVSDESGVDKVTAQVAGAAGNAVMMPSSSAWSLLVELIPGVNNITITAEDEAGNTADQNLTVYYKTNFLPISATSLWKFRRGNDTLSIKVDTTWDIVGFPFHFYRIYFDNQDDGLKDTMIMGYDTLRGVFRVGPTSYEASIGDTLFLRQYTVETRTYSKSSVRFIGDTTLVNSGGAAVPYRNCVNVSFANANDRYAAISNVILAPSHGLVSVSTNASVGFAGLHFELVMP